MRLLARLILSALVFTTLSFGDRIVSGWIHTFPHPYPGAEFHFVGLDFEFNGLTEAGDWPSVRPVSPDNLTPTYGHAFEIDGGPATYRGRYYPNLLLGVDGSWPHSEMFLEGPAIAVNGPGIYTAPFTIRGGLCGMVKPFRLTPEGFYECDVLVGLQGGGTVTLFVDEWGGGLRVSSASYDFANIPEPASIGLVIVGLAGVWAARRRRMEGG